jgi:molybdopterin-guanine dinucleotide biosynthesis protein A
MKNQFTCNGQPLGLIVLAGGRSRRMNRNKALLPVPGGVLIEMILNQLQHRFDQMIISVSDRRKFTFLSDVEIIEDPVPDQGPMLGIYSALAASRWDKNFVIACDIPVINIDFLEKLVSAAAAADIAVPENGKAQLEPLFAIYSRTVRSVMGQLLKKGERSLLPLFDRCIIRRVPLAGKPWMVNLNDRKNYENFLKKVNCETLEDSDG